MVVYLYLGRSTMHFTQNPNVNKIFSFILCLYNFCFYPEKWVTVKGSCASFLYILTFFSFFLFLIFLTSVFDALLGRCDCKLWKSVKWVIKYVAEHFSKILKPFFLQFNFPPAKNKN